MSDTTGQLRYLQHNIPMERIVRALSFMKSQTKVSSFRDALELIQIGKLSAEESYCVTTVITVWRACMDGEVEPLVDLEQLYARIETD